MQPVRAEYSKVFFFEKTNKGANQSVRDAEFVTKALLGAVPRLSSSGE